jgi:hypothetical protein
LIAYSHNPHGALFGVDISFQLNFDTFHQCLPTYYLLYNSGFNDKKGSRSFDFLEVIKTVSDVRDIGNFDVSAELLADGTGMVVTEPLVSQCLLQNVEEWNKKDLFDISRSRDYNTKIGEYNNLPKKVRLTTIKFPFGTIGTTDFIGGKKESSRKEELHTFNTIFDCEATLKAFGKTKKFPSYFITWKIGVQNTLQNLSLLPKNIDGAAQICADFENLSMMQNCKYQMQED